jgi:hypothetical protein
MAKSKTRTVVPRIRARDYRSVAENFYHGAELARDFEYWNASGILIVHAAIALADAIAIKLAGVKSRGEDHHETIALLEEVVATSDEKRKALQHLRRIIDHKNAVSYNGEIYNQTDIDQLWKQVARFREWAIDILD